MSTNSPTFSSADSNGMMWLAGAIGTLTLGPLGAIAATYVGHRLDKRLKSRKDKINYHIYECQLKLVEAMERAETEEEYQRLESALKHLDSQRV